MPKISLDFSEVDAPTGKQVDFVQDICRELDIDKPEEYTKEAYSEFIDLYAEEYYYEINRQRSGYW
jgi:hypothetical protein